MRLTQLFLGSTVATSVAAFSIGLPLVSTALIGFGAGVIISTWAIIKSNPSILSVFLGFAFGYGLLLSAFFSIFPTIGAAIGVSVLLTLIVKLMYS